MNPDAVVLIALIAISGIVAAVLAVAWAEFGRPRHSLAWALAFALTAAMWAVHLATRLHWLAAPPAAVLMPAAGGVAAALIAIGFRERAGLPGWQGPLLGAAGLHAALVLALALGGASPSAWMMTLTAFNAILFTLAAQTLTGRRQGERAAEGVAGSGIVLLAATNLLVMFGLLARAGGLVRLDLGALGLVTMVALPTVVAAIGLFTIILLTADVADQTRRLAATDMLTGILNRRGFEEAARALLQSLRRSRRQIALVLVDIDHFKSVNDRYGHPAGDRVLKEVCATINRGLGRRDVLARVGGEEFALILTDVDVTAARCAAEVLRQEIATMALDLSPPCAVTASFGIAAPEEDEHDLATLFMRADRALYRSKETGRDRVTVAA